jgi:hypothetical protein
MTFARRAFLFGAIWGLFILIPHAFTEGRIGRDHPPAITHPEYFYGFVGIGIRSLGDLTPRRDGRGWARGDRPASGTCRRARRHT